MGSSPRATRLQRSRTQRPAGVLCGIAIALAIHAPAARAADVVAHGSTATQVSVQHNGHVDVVPATARDGVSYNGFDRFNVDAAGLTFRNDDVKARTIVSEVLSASPSRIDGPVDVSGPRANLIVANQNGIRVNGGSFFNFGSVALTTGAVTLRDQAQASGYVQRYVDVHTTQGAIEVGPEGLSGNLIRLEMIAKTVGIQGAVANTYSSATGTVRIVAGESLAQFDTAASPLDNLTPWVYYSAGRAAGDAIALDLSADSKVTSGRIEILVTDQGAGVRNAGQMVAAAGDFRLSSTGLLEQTGGSIQSLGQTHVQAADVLQTNDGERIGLISAGTNAIVETTGSIRNIGGEISGQVRQDDDPQAPYAVLLQAGGVIENRTPLGAAQPALIFGRGDSVALIAEQGIESVNARVVSNGGLTVRTSQAARNESLYTPGAGRDEWQSHNLFTDRRGYTVDMGALDDPGNQAYWVAQGDIDIGAGDFLNLGGQVFSNAGNVRIAARQDVVTRAHSVGQFEYHQSCLLFLCRRSASSTETLVGGQIMAAGTLDISAGGQILNDAGQVYAGQGMQLQAPEIIARGRPVHTVILRDKGLKALLGDTWAQVYAADQGGSFTAQQGRLILQGAARQEGGTFQALDGVDGAIEVIRTPQRDPVRLENHLGILWW